jgi:hypothetical protein
VLELEAGQRNVHLYLQGLLSHLPGKNAEDIATFVDVERQGARSHFSGQLLKREGGQNCRHNGADNKPQIIDDTPETMGNEKEHHHDA